MIAPDGQEVVTGQHVDRRYRFCQCRLCGVVKKCTPRDNFFILAVDGPDAGLLCGTCSWLAHAAITKANASAKRAFDGAVGRGEPEEFTGPPCPDCGSRDCACVDEANR